MFFRVKWIPQNEVTHFQFLFALVSISQRRRAEMRERDIYVRIFGNGVWISTNVGQILTDGRQFGTALRRVAVLFSFGIAIYCLKKGFLKVKPGIWLWNMLMPFSAFFSLCQQIQMTTRLWSRNVMAGKAPPLSFLLHRDLFYELCF